MLNAAISIDENGDTQTGRVWTGTRTDGTARGRALGETPGCIIFIGLPCNGTFYGLANVLGNDWIDAGFRTVTLSNNPNDPQYALYAISGVLTVEASEVHEPGTVGIMMLAVMGIAWRYQTSR